MARREGIATYVTYLKDGRRVTCVIGPPKDVADYMALIPLERVRRVAYDHSRGTSYAEHYTDDARDLPARNELERESGRRNGE